MYVYGIFRYNIIKYAATIYWYACMALTDHDRQALTLFPIAT